MKRRKKFIEKVYSRACVFFHRLDDFESLLSGLDPEWDERARVAYHDFKEALEEVSYPVAFNPWDDNSTAK